VRREKHLGGESHNLQNKGGKLIARGYMRVASLAQGWGGGLEESTGGGGFGGDWGTSKLGKDEVRRVEVFGRKTLP